MVLTPVPLSETQAGPFGLNASPHAFCKFESSLDATPSWSETRFVCFKTCAIGACWAGGAFSALDGLPWSESKLSSNMLRPQDAVASASPRGANVLVLIDILLA